MLFYRYLALLEKLGAEVTFKVKSILHKLFKNKKNKFKFIDKFPSDNKFDYESPLISLPYLFGTEVEKIPASKYYLKADSIKINEWSQKLKSDNFKIGYYLIMMISHRFHHIPPLLPGCNLVE